MRLFENKLIYFKKIYSLFVSVFQEQNHVQNRLVFAANLGHQLLTSPTGISRGRFGGVDYEARIVKRGYRKSVDDHFKAFAPSECKAVEFDDFGVLIVFSKPTNVTIYDDNWVLDAALKGLVKAFGAVFLENVYLSDKQREDGQKNIFPSLAFHVDRGKFFDNQYSMFVRDPKDPEQHFPRKSGTLIVSNRAAVLQARKEGKGDIDLGARHDLFTGENVEDLFDSVILHQPWAADEGVGEICLFDNRTVLHASYYKDKQGGYKIGVRYLF